MDFSDPYIVNSQAVLMRVEDHGVSLEDFKSKGKKLSAQANTTDAQVAEGVVGKENVVAYDSFSAAIIALKNKDVDGVVINGANAAAYERESSANSWWRSGISNPIRSASSSARAMPMSPPSTKV